MDALKDFAYSLVTNSPGTSGTSITVTSGTGTLFPSAPFSATVWPAGQAPTASNAEIVRVTVVSTDTFTITRNYEGPASPINITAGYQIAQTITQGLLNQLLPLTGGTVTTLTLTNPLAVASGGTNSNVGNLVKTTQSVTVSSNAASVSASYGSTLITNNAAGSVAITLSTSGAVDGQTSVVRFLDFSAVAQTLSWVNTENSQVTVPTLSNGSTTSPLSVGFIYNGATSKWRCMATA